MRMGNIWMFNLNQDNLTVVLEITQNNPLPMPLIASFIYFLIPVCNISSFCTFLAALVCDCVAV